MIPDATELEYGDFTKTRENSRSTIPSALNPDTTPKPKKLHYAFASRTAQQDHGSLGIGCLRVRSNLVIGIVGSGLRACVRFGKTEALCFVSKSLVDKPMLKFANQIKLHVSCLAPW